LSLASRYTDYAISAPKEIFTKDKLNWGGGGEIGLRAQFKMKQKENKGEGNKEKEMVCVTFVKQLVQCDCIA
jgi:hypothetical protein